MPDYLGYRLDWTEEEAKYPLPSLRLLATAAQWDLAEGGHPMLPLSENFYKRDPFKDTQNPRIDMPFQIRPMGCVHGHNTLADSAFSDLIDVDINVPISPLFVKDLCGRIIYIGYGPEEKSFDQWASYGTDKIDAEGMPLHPRIPSITFPRHCVQANGNMQGAEMLEEVLFCKFRTLDIAFDYTGVPSGQKDLLAAGIYKNANLYPYKLRLDSFYIDGYKMPQTNMVYAIREGIDRGKAKKLGEELLQKWKNKPADQNYMDFYEEGGADEWFDKLFEQGCTVIPTFESCNGFHVVGNEFQLEDYWPGRSVEGLHEVVEERADKAPVGTILDVLEPGYVTAEVVKPAKVIISDGSGYISPHYDNPLPMIPNLLLPHQRTVANWWATWLPTHPAHFEAPAIWGWDGATGRFLQLMGPLWDPLHYYYDCMDPIIFAMKKPRQDNNWLVDVPLQMKNKFYPIVQMQGFDVPSLESKERRKKRNSLPRSYITRIRNGQVSADTAYHPLPTYFEYEMDPWWFPNLHPLHRNIGPCPEDFNGRIAPIIKSYVSPDLYVEHVNGPEEALWLKDKDMLAVSMGNPEEDYPQLLRYVNTEIPIEDVMSIGAGIFLQDIDDHILYANPQELWGEVDHFSDLDELAPHFYDAVCDMRERSADHLRRRHAIYRRNPVIYTYGWWHCMTPDQMEELFREWENQEEGDLMKKDTNQGTRVASVIGVPEQKDS